MDAPSPAPELHVRCSHCGGSDLTTIDLIKVSGRALDLSTTFAQEASLYKYQLEHVQQRYFDLLSRHDPAQLEATQSELKARFSDFQAKQNEVNFVDDAYKNQLRSLFKECDEWTQRVKQRNQEWEKPTRSIRSRIKPAMSRRTTSDTRIPNAIHEANERDFTTSGTPSALRCPFQPSKDNGTTSTADPATLDTPASSQSKKQYARIPRSKRASFNDPIRAEICGNDPLPSAALTEGSAACPIRFLDQHSPEELAEYFEKHKHELPRSHEVCVRRYQKDSDSIRQLDAKYGNLADMIQGLGEKHQHWLPDQPAEGDEAAVDERSSSSKVQKWANEVAAVQDQDPNGLASPSREDEPRQSHFDRPVKDVRVGESPSRPWGVSIPAKYYENADPPKGTKRPPGPSAEDTRPPGKCPFNHLKRRPAPLDTTAEPGKMDSKPQADYGAPPVIIPNSSLPTAQETGKSAQPQMLFTGPVFIGYPSDDVVALLQKAQNGHQT